MVFLNILVIAVVLALYFDLRYRIKRVEESHKGTGEVLPSEAHKEEKREEQPVHAEEVSRPREKFKASDLEIKWGGKLFTAIGGVALLFGVGFFLRYAFENNLIAPIMRVVIGLAGGLICIGLGEWLRRKYASYGQTLMGLGLGIFYLTLYAALHLYHVMSAPQTFIAMIAVTVAGLVLAVRLNSEALAAFAQLGGLLTPMLISTEENKPYVLFPYLALLDITVLVFALMKAWRGVTLVGILGTAVVFTSWYGKFFTDDQWLVTQLAVTTFFVIFVIAGLARYVIHKTKQDSSDLAVTALNPFLYAAATYVIVPDIFREWVGTYFALLGVLYLGATLLIKGHDERDRRYRNFLAVIGSAFLAAAAPIAYDENAVTIAWAVLAAGLTYLSYALDSKPLRAAAVGIGLFASLDVLTTAGGQISAVNPWLNERFMTSLFVIVAMCATTTMHWLKGAKDSQIQTWVSLDAIKAYLVACILLGSEIAAFYDRIWIIAAMALIALAGGGVSLLLRSVPLRVAAYATYALTVLSLMADHSAISASSTFILNKRFLIAFLLILSAWAFSYLVRRSPDEVVKQSERDMIRPVFFIGIHLTGLWLVSTEVLSWFNLRLSSAAEEARISLRAAKNASISVTYMVYALALLIYGIAKKTMIARRFAIVLFGFVILKAFLYDTAELSNFYRFISFMTLGVLLLVSGYLYTRFRERIKRFVA